MHERWDLRFSKIEYLERGPADEPQRFLYSTRIGFGLAIRGTGETMGERALLSGESTSALGFASADAKSLIREGSGYWRYIPGENGIRFLTWYDYRVRFGWAGRMVDRFLFRPLIGWATAWSFDRLRLWAEGRQGPEVSGSLFAIYAIARVTVAFVWIWHGLVPKLVMRHVDEQEMLAQAGLPIAALPWIGIAEVLFGVAILAAWRRTSLLLLSAVGMLVALVTVALRSPAYLGGAFNPVSLNLAVTALSCIAWASASQSPSAEHCLRSSPDSAV